MSDRASAKENRVRAAMIDAAARVLASTGGTAKLEEIADAAGVSRATVYRYFTSREKLLVALVDTAYRDLVERVAAASLESVDFPEGLARLARACAATGQRFVVTQQVELPASPTALDEEFERQLDLLLEKGKHEGRLRPDLDLLWLRFLFRGVVMEALRYADATGEGAECTATRIVEGFLDGAGAARL